MSIAIRKNTRKELRVERQDYRGHDLINLHVCDDDGTDEYRPGKQGIVSKAKVLPDVLEAPSGFSDQREAA